MSRNFNLKVSYKLKGFTKYSEQNCFVLSVDARIVGRNASQLQKLSIGFIEFLIIN